MRTMINPQYLDTARLDEIGGDVWSTNYDQFPGPFDTACPATMAMLDQTFYLLFNFISLVDGR